MKRRTMSLLAATTLLLLMTGAAPATARVVFYVDGAAGGANDGTSWEDAFTDLQSALAVARDAEVWVAAGVYKPTPGIDREASFVIPSGATVLGGFEGGETNSAERDPDENRTVLSGEIGAPARGDNSIHVVTTRRTKAVQTLDGFLIRGGFASVKYSVSSYDGSGAGLVNVGGRPALLNLRFRHNAAKAAGGGAASWGGYPRFSHAVFLGNVAGNRFVGAGGGLYVRHGRVALSDVRFEGNHSGAGGGGMMVAGADMHLRQVVFSKNIVNGRSNGGGLLANGATATVVDAIFERNSAYAAGGASLFFRTARLDRVLFRDNRAQTGSGALQVEASAHVANATFVGNEIMGRAGFAGAVYTAGGTLALVNSTFVRNSAGRGAGAIFSYSGNVTVSQSIFWENSGNTFGTWHRHPGRMSLADAVLDQRCPSYVLCSGTLLHGDPRLQPLAPNGGFAPSMALELGSSAIDAGTNARCAADDQRGVARPVDGDGDGEARCDLGAYEYVPGEGTEDSTP